MRVKPHKWTKHHTHRVLHVSTFMAALMAVIALSWVFGYSLVSIQAQDIPLSTGVGVTVNEIAAGPSVPVGSPSGSVVQPHLTEAPFVTVEPINSTNNKYTKSSITIDGGPRTVYSFNTSTPGFTGHTNIKNALVHIEIYNGNFYNINLYADNNGDWTFAFPNSLASGNYMVIVSAQDQTESRLKATVEFLVSTQRGNNNFPSIPAHPSAVYPDVIISIPEQYKSISGGKEVLAKVKFVNYGSEKKTVEVQSRYTITDPSGKIIVSSQDSIQAGTQLEIIKTFYTNETLLPGVYKITVTVSSAGSVVTSTDSFEIKAHAPIALTNTNTTIDYRMLEIIIPLIIIFLIILFLEYNKIQLLSQVIKQLRRDRLLKV